MTETDTLQSKLLELLKIETCLIAKNIEKTNRNEADSASPYYGRLNHDSSGL